METQTKQAAPEAFGTVSAVVINIAKPTTALIPELVKAELVARAETEVKELLTGGFIERIDTDEQVAAALGLCKKIKLLAETYDAKKKEVLDPYKREIETGNNFFKSISETLKTAENNLKSAILSYNKEVERKRLELIEAENKRLEKERLEREADQKKEQEEADARAKLLIKQADELKASGQADEAQVLLETAKEISDAVVVEPTPIAPPVAVFAPPAPKLAGFGVAKYYSAVVKDHEKYCRSCVEKGLFYLLQPDTTALNKMASAAKTAFKMDGAELVVEERTSVSKRR